MQERGGGREAAARLRPTRREFELVRDVFVRVGSRSRAMPGTTIGIDFWIRHLGQRQVGRSALRTVRRPVDGGSCQWVPECNPLAYHEQAVCLHVISGRWSDAQAFSGAPEQHRITERLGRRKQQQPPRVTREQLELSSEAALDPSRKVLRSERPKATRQLRRCQPSRQLQQRQRISAHLGNDPIADSFIQLESHRRTEQRARVSIAYALQGELGQMLQRIAGLTRREHDPDRVCLQATGDEGQRQR